MEKTLREWLEELPEPYRSQAIENGVKYHGLDQLNRGTSGNIHGALYGSFEWGDTEQGFTYWADFKDSIPNE